MVNYDIVSIKCMRGVQQSYVPILYEDLVNQPGPIGRLAKPRAARQGRHQQPFAPTSPRPMAFELRAQTRPKTIMQARLVSMTPYVNRSCNPVHAVVLDTEELAVCIFHQIAAKVWPDCDSICKQLQV